MVKPLIIIQVMKSYGRSGYLSEEKAEKSRVKTFHFVYANVVLLKYEYLYLCAGLGYRLHGI